MDTSTPQTPVPTPVAPIQAASADTRTIMTVLCLFFFFPVGLILMWFWTKWKRSMKILITIVALAWAIIGTAIAVTTVNKLLNLYTSPTQNLKNSIPKCIDQCKNSPDSENCESRCLQSALFGTFIQTTPAPFPSTSLSQTDALNCNLSVSYPFGWEEINKAQDPKSDYPNMDFTCLSILSPEYIENIKKFQGPGSAYMGFEVLIKRTEIGSVFKNVTINNLDDYITSKRNVWEPPAELSKLEVKDMTIGIRKGKNYIFGGFMTWRNFIFVEGEYIYNVSYPVNSDGTSISPYDKEVNSIIESIRFN